MAPTVRIGINPITWTNDDVPELGGDTPLETCLAETAGGLCRHRARRQVSARSRRSSSRSWQRHGLALVSGWYDGRMLPRARSTRSSMRSLPHLQLLQGYAAAKHVVYADTSLGRHGGDLAADLAAAVADRRTNGRPMAASSPRLPSAWPISACGMAFHHHMGTIVETDAEVDRLMAQTGEAVGLLYRHRPFDLRRRRSAGARRSGTSKRIVHVHCKDVAQGDPRQGARRRHELHGCGASTASSPCRATASSTIRPS